LTWSSLPASAEVNCCRLSTVANRSLSLPDSVSPSLPSEVIVSLSALPLPLVFLASVFSRSDSAPFLLAPLGPSVVLTRLRLAYRSSTSSGVAVRSRGRTVPSAIAGPPV
jgi:hypothetical protein